MSFKLCTSGSDYHGKHCQTTYDVNVRQFFPLGKHHVSVLVELKKKQDMLFQIATFVIPVVASPRRRHASFISLFIEITNRNRSQLFSQRLCPLTRL